MTIHNYEYATSNTITTTTIMASAQLINCIICKTPVRPRQRAIQCDGCYRWNHRMCNTGISQEEYRAAVREGNGIDWCCPACASREYRSQLGAEGTRSDDGE